MHFGKNGFIGMRKARLALVTATATIAIGVPFVVGAFTKPIKPLPATIDARGPNGVPHGLSLVQPSSAQLRSLDLLGRHAGAAQLRVQYNGLTATPHALANPAGYLTAASGATPEAIARKFLSDNRELYRFSDEDLEGLRLRSMTRLPDTGTTVLMLQQTVGGVPVYQGNVLINVSKSGRVINASDDSFPQLNITNTRSLSEAQAVSAAARSFGLSYSPSQIGTHKVLTTYGQLPQEFVDAPRFSGGGVFSDDIDVTRTIFPLGGAGRHAYEFILVTPQFQGVMWQCIVDAQTGAVLRRVSLTHFVSAAPGGGVGQGRRATFRPDVQDFIERLNSAQTASGYIFDTHPVTLSDAGGVGRATRTGTAPANYVYRSPVYEAEVVANSFRYSLASARNEEALPFPGALIVTNTQSFTQAELPDRLGQVLRGFPDALHPSASSPFGWFYLPTGANGAEIPDGDGNRAGTRAFGYNTEAGAVTRNRVNPANSPNGSGSQPYSVSVTTLPGPVTVTDGRVISRAIESAYTEGNNVLVADDRGNDNDAALGIRGYNPTRQFTAPYFLFTNTYEFGGEDAASNTDGSVNYPASADADIFADTVSLFFGNNLEHDYLYSIGFTEATWNFQQDNFGKGGAGSDAVSAQVQDGSGTDNANFGTPADGSRPTMQMYLFTDGGIRRSDGAFDWDVYAHEYYHGVSTRSAGKGSAGCLVAGVGLTGEAGGQGEGWSDTIASSLADDDNEGEYVTGAYDIGIRRIPYTNFLYSYGEINGVVRRRRDQGTPGVGVGIPFEVHDVGEVWAATLWDMRELLIAKDPNGLFFDGTRRLGAGTSYYIGSRLVQSVDTRHPIDYRSSFRTTTGSGKSVTAADIVRPGRIAAEIASRGDRLGPLATAVNRGARLADTLVLRGLQLGPCQPSFIDSRDSILAADREMTGGENRAVIWRAMASHGVGAAASSTSSTDTTGTAGAAPVVVEDFTVPTGVSQCETQGPLPVPSFVLTNTTSNTVTVRINGGVPVAGANQYLISRATSQAGPYVLVASVPAATTSYNDNDGGTGLQLGVTYYYQVRAARDAAADCVSQFDPALTRTITLNVGVVPRPAPVFAGVSAVDDPAQCTLLTLSWLPASSTNPTARIVYDVYRVSSADASVTLGNGTTAPTFTATPANRIATNLTTTSYIDTNLDRNQVYYYIVRARDTDNNQIDSGNLGNTAVRINAPSSSVLRTPAPFALESYEANTANNRFTPPLRDYPAPDITQLTWEHVANADLGGGVTSGVMYAPDVDPSSGGVTDPVLGITINGAPSDNSTMIGPLTITADSALEFDSRIQSETSFDGGVVELAFAPVFNTTPFPDNITAFDLGAYMVTGGYNGALDGPAPAGGGFGSALQGRRAFTGTRGLRHTRIPLKDFAPGGRYNTTGRTVYIRFRMTTDVGSNAGPTSGWYVDNLVVNSQDICPVNIRPTAVLRTDVTIGQAPLTVNFDGSGSTDPDTNDRVRSFLFDFGDGTTSRQDGPTVSHVYRKGTWTARLTVFDNAGAASDGVTQTITAINNVPVAAISANPTTQAKGNPVSFDASASTDADNDTLTYTFDFGDGSATTTQPGATITHIYARGGSYTARVTVNDGTVNSSPASVAVTITNTAPTARLTATPLNGIVPFAVTFDASTSSDPDTGDRVQFYHFNYGDGTTEDITVPTARHTYTTRGIYNATVTVDDTDGRTSANAGLVTITADAANTAPVARLAVTPASGRAPIDTTLNPAGTADADGDALTYVYDFGDGTTGVSTTSSAPVPHRYVSSGTYTARVTVTDGRGGSSTATVTVTYVANTAPVARLAVTPSSGREPLNVSLDPAGSSDVDNDPLTYVYDFGDGSPIVTLTTPTPASHVYAAGNYTARLTVNDGRGGTSSATVAVTVQSAGRPRIGGNGGSFGWMVLGPLAALGWLRRRRTSAKR